MPGHVAERQPEATVRQLDRVIPVASHRGAPGRWQVTNSDLAVVQGRNPLREQTGLKRSSDAALALVRGCVRERAAAALARQRKQPCLTLREVTWNARGCDEHAEVAAVRLERDRHERPDTGRRAERAAVVIRDLVDDQRLVASEHLGRHAAVFDWGRLIGTT